jgi:hypothetical protein
VLFAQNSFASFDEGEAAYNKKTILSFAMDIVYGTKTFMAGAQHNNAEAKAKAKAKKEQAKR